MQQVKATKSPDFLEVTFDDGTISTVPVSDNNWQYRDFVKPWLDAGGTITPADPEPDLTIDKIKAEAQKRIITLTGGGPYWREKQSNMIARASEINRREFLNEKDPANNPPLTAQEQAEMAAILAFWDKVKAIRAHSNALEEDHNAGEVVNISAGTSSIHPSGWPY